MRFSFSREAIRTQVLAIIVKTSLRWPVFHAAVPGFASGSVAESNFLLLCFLQTAGDGSKRSGSCHPDKGNLIEFWTPGFSLANSDCHGHVRNKKAKGRPLFVNVSQIN